MNKTKLKSVSGAKRDTRRSVSAIKLVTTREASKHAMVQVHDELEILKTQIDQAIHQVKTAISAISQTPEVPLLELLRMPSSKLRLSTRAKMRLEENRLETVGHIAAFSVKGLANLRGISAKTAKQIERAVNHLGIPIGFSVPTMNFALGNYDKIPWWKK